MRKKPESWKSISRRVTKELDDLEVERALMRARSMPGREITRQPQVSLPFTGRCVKRDPVIDLERMLEGRQRKLDRLWEGGASQVDVEDAQLWVEALQRELALARAGELPSVLDALRS